MKAEAVHRRDELSIGLSGDALKIGKLGRIIQYVTGMNRLYWLSCCMLIFFLTGLFYALYPDISMVFVVISLLIGFVCWAVVWVSIILQIKKWNRAVNKIHAG